MAVPQMGGVAEVRIPATVSAKEDIPLEQIVLLPLARMEPKFSLKDQSQFGILRMDARTEGSMEYRGKVWLLVSDAVMKDLEIANIRSKVQKASYSIQGTSRISSFLLGTLYDAAAQQEEKVKESSRSKTEAEKGFHDILRHAVEHGVSDIHMEKRKSIAKIRMRKHGQLLDYVDMTPLQAQEIASMAYMTLGSNQDSTFDPSSPQSASINQWVEGVEVMLRWQSAPASPDGFDAVLRLLPLKENNEYVELDKLGYAPSQVVQLMTIVSKPVGACIIAGTTGSGKSTTLKNLIEWVNATRGYRIKIITVEDPPEYRIYRVTQVPATPPKDKERNRNGGDSSPFAAPVKAAMRLDPDILMIGEVRDSVTASALQKGTQSGHQMFTTTHTGSALGIAPRLTDLGIVPSVLGDPEFITGLIYQKLAPTLCEHCKVPFVEKEAPAPEGAPDGVYERLVELFGKDLSSIYVRSSSGCQSCGGMSVTGRTVCAEIIEPDHQLLQHLRSQQSVEAYEYWRGLSDGDPRSVNMTGKAAIEHAIYKIHLGIVSPLDIEEIFGPLDGPAKMLIQMKGNGNGHNGTGSVAPAISNPAMPSVDVLGERTADPGLVWEDDV